MKKTVWICQIKHLLLLQIQKYLWMPKRKCVKSYWPLQHHNSVMSMGVGRIFSRGGPVRDIPKIFSRGGPKVVKFGFYLSKLKKQPFFADNFTIQGGLAPYAPLPTPMVTRFKQVENQSRNHALRKRTCQCIHDKGNAFVLYLLIIVIPQLHTLVWSD